MRLSSVPLLFLVVACKKDPVDVNDIPDDATTGTLRIDLGGDATAQSGDEDSVGEGEVDEVWIRVDQVEVEHEDEGWIIMSDERTDIDLMSLREDGERLASGDVYEGAYDNVRFVITDAWILVGGEEYDLDVDGVDGGSGELELDVSFFVDADTVTDLWLGWDLDSQLRGSDDNWSLKSDVNVDVDVEAAD